MKMKRFFKVVLVGVCMVALAAAVAGCTAPAADSHAGGKEIDVSFEGGMLSCTGDTMTVALDANATTGSEWASSIEGEAVKAVGDEYKAETSSDGKAGAGGVHTFTYQGEGSGEATITLKYARSWEASDADKTVVVKTEVKDGAFAEASVQ